MADLSGSHFTYGTYNSADDGLIFANMDSPRFLNIGGDSTIVTVFNKKEKRFLGVDNDYSASPLSFEIEIVREDGDLIPWRDAHRIARRLFNRTGYRRLYLSDEDDCAREMRGHSENHWYTLEFTELEDPDFSKVAKYQASISSQASSDMLQSIYEALMADKPGFFHSSDCLLTIIKDEEEHYVFFRYNCHVEEEQEVDYNDPTQPLYSGAIYYDEGIYKLLVASDRPFDETDLFGIGQDAGTERLYLNCRMTSVEKIDGSPAAAGGISGWRLTIETDSGYWWQEQITKTFTPSGNNIFSLDVDSDMDDYIYPKVIITTSTEVDEPNITLTNLSDNNRQTAFNFLSSGSRTIIDGNYNYVSAGYTNMRIKNMPRLVQGVNKIQIVGDGISSVSFTFQNRRFF